MLLQLTGRHPRLNSRMSLEVCYRNSLLIHAFLNYGRTNGANISAHCYKFWLLGATPTLGRIDRFSNTMSSKPRFVQGIHLMVLAREQ